MKYYLITFKNNNHAVAVNSYLKSRNKNNQKLISVPIRIKKSCGLCIKTFDVNIVYLVKNEYSKNFPIDIVYTVKRENSSYTYKRLRFSSK